MANERVIKRCGSPCAVVTCHVVQLFQRRSPPKGLLEIAVLSAKDEKKGFPYTLVPGSLNAVAVSPTSRKLMRSYVREVPSHTFLSCNPALSLLGSTLGMNIFMILINDKDLALAYLVPISPVSLLKGDILRGTKPDAPGQ